MLSINMDDVLNVITNIQNYLIVLAVVLVAAIVVNVVAMKFTKPVKRLVRGEAWIAFVLTIIIVINLICTGPMKTMLDLVSGEGSIEDATSAKATELVVEITQEGIALVENKGILPLAENTKLNVFGWASTNPCYGGTGSGALNDAYPTVDILEGLQRAGIETNTELSQFYVDYKADRPSVAMSVQDWTQPEPNVNLYTEELVNNAKNFSDVAMIVITRVGGEGADLPTDMTAVVDETWKRRIADWRGEQRGAGYYNGSYDDTLNEGNDWDEGDHFLQLSNREEEMIELVTSNFDNVILLYNSASAFEMDWVKDYPEIKGVLICPGTGQSGFEALGKVVTGEVNPSGRTVDTYATTMEKSPWWNNFGDFKYTNAEEYTGDGTSFDPAGTTPSFLNYVEGIYVGYKYYETAAKEGLINYDEEVVYPFGYGLSYTTFTQTMSDIVYSNDSLNFEVTVTNTGSVSGKEVVQIYAELPYTNGGIEKSSANLLDFGKTQILEPGASETISFSILMEELASFDYKNLGCYVVEAGDYIISANSNSHTVLDSRTYTVSDVVVYDENNKRESDDSAAVTQFEYAEGDTEYLSRADGFANFAVATAAPSTEDYEMSGELKAVFNNAVTYVESGYAVDDAAAGDVEPITTGAQNGLSVLDVRGLEYDDPTWDLLLDQLTLDEMNDLIGHGGYQTVAIESIGKVRTNDCDGPASINNNFTGVGSVGFPAATLIGMTWNKELAYAFGDSIGTMADQMNTSGWYGPAMNIHRSPFSGRNFEYYSEDPVLSGIFASQAISGAQAHGIYAYMKHFALNDQEGNRNSMLCTWADEQTIREIYLKPFEIAVKKGNSQAVMSSFNYIGSRWAGGDSTLLNTVLRDEWGFTGFVETDYFGVYGAMTADQAIRNGGDLMLATYDSAYNYVTQLDSNNAQASLRQSAKNILYVVANSRAYADENLVQTTPIWRTLLTIANVVLIILLIVWQALVIKAFLKRRSENTVEIVNSEN